MKIYKTLSVTSKAIRTGLTLYSYGNIRVLQGSGCSTASNGYFGNVGSGNFPKMNARVCGYMKIESTHYTTAIGVDINGDIFGTWFDPTTTTTGAIGTQYSNNFTLVWTV